MPTCLTLNDPIHAISASHGFQGELIEVETEGFYTTNDGGKFIDLLEMLSEHLRISRLHASSMDHLLFVLSRTNEAILYMNELNFIQTITCGRDVQKGDGVHEDHIVDVHQLEFVGSDGCPVNVLEDRGVIFMFSIGWRKGLYFNFQPMRGPDGNVSDYPARLGRVYGQLQFQEKTSLDEGSQAWKAGGSSSSGLARPGEWGQGLVTAPEGQRRQGACFRRPSGPDSQTDVFPRPRGLGRGYASAGLPGLRGPSRDPPPLG